MAFCWISDNKIVNRMKRNMNIESDDGGDNDNKNNCSYYVLLRTLQLAFGYSGLRANMIVAILLLVFLIPLGLNLAAVINSSKEIDSDPFDMFPVDPFPSSTICFTNFTILNQQEKWENKTETFSNSCNKTFEAIPCQDVRKTIIAKVSIIIGIMAT